MSGPAVPMDREAVDQALQRLTAESERVAESLMAMDAHPGHQLLRNATLAGKTKQRWAEISTTMATLWEQFTKYRSLLDRAKEVRARRSRPGDAELAELTKLLSGPVVVLNAEHVPIEQRSLTGPAQVVQRVTLAELVEEMKEAYSAITEVLADADAGWSAAVGQLDPLEQELAEVTTLAESVDVDTEPEIAADLNRVRYGLSDTRRLAMSDPLTVLATRPVRALRARLAEIRTRLTELAAVRDTFDDRLRGVEATLADVDTAHADLRDTVAVVVEKIASPTLPTTVNPSADLRQQVGALRGKAGNWMRRSAELDRLSDAAAGALGEARAAVRSVTALLDRRAELRGRLEAYRAKAAGRGLLENLRLEALHKRAYDLLYTAPCDLAAATRALNRYQEAMLELASPPAPEEGTR